MLQIRLFIGFSQISSLLWGAMPIMGADAPATLDFRQNPRWGVVQTKNTIEVNQRFDWIMMKNPYPLEFPKLKQCSLFGTEISGETGLAASDHYGVCAEIQIQERGTL